ncbi:MAG TPA: flagellar biosynthesis protein FlhF, partial [Candidatus Hydrogenedentes bacterium]|nr:flagellar biosynthesis protein FlhF [Candidatus Hydrogenedentota bacterium]
MGHKLYRFRATTLNEALRCMRAKLGPDAVVVNTSEVREGGFLGFLSEKKFELTATAGPSATSNEPGQRRPSIPERIYAAQSPPRAAEGIAETRAYYQKVVEEAQQRLAPATKTNPGEGRTAGGRVVPFRNTEPAPAAEGSRRGHPMDDMRHSVNEMREMLQVLVAETADSGPVKEYAEHYRALVNQGLSRRLAASLIERTVKSGSSDLLKDRRIFRERLKLQIRSDVQATNGLMLTPGIRRTIALVGPTGVGKTTNVAKLAAEFAVRERLRVAMVTCDTFRIAAPEQLRVYAEIIDVPMQIVNDANEMAAAMRTFSDYDLILVDTAGGSQFNIEQLEELKQTLTPARPDEVLLLLGANTQLHELYNTLDSFSRLRPTSLFFTKLDETRHYGSLYSLYAESKLPLSYFSTGQSVPDDIEIVNPGKVAHLVVEAGETCDRSST